MISMRFSNDFSDRFNNLFILIHMLIKAFKTSIKFILFNLILFIYQITGYKHFPNY
jgi:hypothetical protein